MFILSHSFLPLRAQGQVVTIGHSRHLFSHYCYSKDRKVCIDIEVVFYF